MNTISELWDGKIAPCEHCGARDAKANLMFAGIRRSKEALEAALPEVQQSLAEKYAQCWEDYLMRMMELSFREGVILGMRLGAEVFSDSK